MTCFSLDFIKGRFIMGEVRLQKYFKQRLRENESHVLAMYKEAFPFQSPHIIKTLEELRLNPPKKYRLLLKGIHTTIVLTL